MSKNQRSSSPQRQASAKPPAGRLGVWVFGALGGLATTLIVGAKAVGKGKAGGSGMLTETELCRGLGLAGVSQLVFGGHEVRSGSVHDSAIEIHESTGTIPYPLLLSLKRDLDRTSREVKPGVMVNAGRRIKLLADREGMEGQTLREQVERLQSDIRDFMRRHRLRRCICVNLMSTEPQVRLTRTHQSIKSLERAIDLDHQTVVRPSTLYAYAAASLRLAFIHFTPSNATLIPAVRQLFERNRTPFMGMDGKTGETLVKSALAPMFRYRNLEVLSWQGYNILGDRDGSVLADDENKRSKVESKDALLSSILGYSLHTHVGIDYVPSLSDLKTAWDFIHFRGFLDYKMSMQFTWQGCDAILAAPIVLDMIRLVDLSQRRGEFGPLHYLACFFKRPVGVDQHDLHRQWHLLTEYLDRVRAGNLAPPRDQDGELTEPTAS